MKTLLATLLLFSSLQALANQEPRLIIETGVETKKFVQKNMGKIQQEAAVHSEAEQVYLDDSMTCLSSHSYIPEVGICQLTGDLGEEGTESAFVVIVSEENPGSGDGKVQVQVLRVSAVTNQ